MRERQRFSIRKFGVGVGSVLIGLTIFATSGNVAAADEKQNNEGNFGSVASGKDTNGIRKPLQNATEKPIEDEKDTVEPTQRETENVKDTEEVVPEAEIPAEGETGLEEVVKEEPEAPVEAEKEPETSEPEESEAPVEGEKDTDNP
ncbi:YSIRK-type signal peptide-containing protein, partial [Mammaliicoccus lentus]|uniref:YSIRK-type signal peptide-containing protein n=1 Tax=Mammaliicoccus lentus TaxID=42858 RepID=UPI001B3416A7